MPVTPGTRFGRYRVEDVIGSGGMGVVYAAVDEHLGRRVALKVMAPHLDEDPAFRRRFLREASVLGHLDSPHIVQVHDHGEIDGRLWIATQLVDGGDLATRLAEQGPLPAGAAVRVCAQVAEALQVAHVSGIVHRDVKPENILLTGDTDDLHAYLTDFGVAREIGGDLTAVRSATGTWDYLAPECGRGQAATPASDVYAVGGLLWTCLTGRAPYAGTVAEVALAHARKPPPALPKASHISTRAINGVIATAMHKDPDQRHDSAARLAAELRSLDTTQPTAPRRRVLLAAAGVAAVVAGVTIVALSAGGDDPAPTVAEARPITGDIDADGFGDQVVTTHLDSGVQLSVARSDGTSLRAAEPFATAPANTFMLRGDVTGDGTPELVGVAGRRDGRYRATIFPSDGSAPRTQAMRASRRATPLHAVLGDFDGDGDDDLALTTDAYGEAPGRVWVAASDGEGFGELQRWYAGKDPLELAVPGDFDGDGDDDLAFVGNDTLQSLTSDGSGFTAEDPDVQPRRIDTLAPGDFDGDGTDELIGLNEARDGFTVWHRGEDGWTGTRRGAISGQVAGSVPSGVADFNGDGLDDVLVVTGDYELPTLQFRVSLSTGDDFDEQSTWLDHDRKVGDFFALVGAAAQ